MTVRKLEHVADWPTWLTFLIPLLIVIVAVVIVLGSSSVGVLFKDSVGSQVFSLLATLTLIALFLERALEVFIGVWREPQANQMDLLIEASEQKIQEINKLVGIERTANETELQDQQRSLSEMKEIKTRYKSQTKSIALWVALGSGLLISLSGGSCCESLLDPAALSSLATNQLNVFHIADVLLTGGLLAGGSDGIHKITQAYTDFMDKTSTTIKDKKPDASPAK